MVLNHRSEVRILQACYGLIYRFNFYCPMRISINRHRVFIMSIHPIFILVSIWSGVIIFFSAVVAPTVFKSLEERDAGVFLRTFFPKYYIFGICGVLSFSVLMAMPISSSLTYAIVAMTSYVVWKNVDTYHQQS